MKFLRYVALSMLIMQPLCLSAMTTRQKSDVIRQITTAFGNETSWFGDPKNSESLKALINKLGTVEKNSQQSYLKLLELKIEAALTLQKRSINSENTRSVEVKIKQEDITTKNLTPARNDTITQKEAIALIQSKIQDNSKKSAALQALLTLAMSDKSTLIKDSFGESVIIVKRSDVYTILAQYAEAETKKKAEKATVLKQDSADTTKDKPLLNYFESYKLLLDALNKTKINDLQMIRRAANNDLHSLSKSQRTVKKDDITYLHKDDVQAIIGFHSALNSLHNNQEETIAEENEGVVAGTLVGTPKGLVAVEKLKAGDLVLNYDLQTQKITKNKVQKIAKKTVDETVTITLANETIDVAPNHLFYLPLERTWIRAKNLTKNNIILNATDDKLAIIKAVEIIKKKTDVYALSVDNVHNFILSKHNILVHNVGTLIEVLKPVVKKSPIGPFVIAACIGGAWFLNYIQSKKASLEASPQSTETSPTSNFPGPLKPDDDGDENDNFIMDLTRITLKNLDPSIGDLKKLEKAVNAVKNLPGAMTKDGPITKLLENGFKGANEGQLATARGAAYEIEAAYHILRLGEEITSLGTKIVSRTASREVDITTKTRLIECKNIDWSKVDMAKLKSQLGSLKQIATDLGKECSVLSKQVIPDPVKEWLIKKGITFFEEFK